MTLNPKKSPFLFSLLCAWGTLLVASAFPIWVPAKGVSFSFHGAKLLDVHRDISWVTESIKSGALPEAWTGIMRGELYTLYLHMLLIATFALTFGAVSGRVCFWFWWERWHRSIRELPDVLRNRLKRGRSLTRPESAVRARNR